MAVLVEAISVIVRRDAINKGFIGGWRGFLNAVPNNTLCADDDLARVGFMSPPDVEEFVRHLERAGLVFTSNGKALDIAVVDQMRGPTIPAEWLEFAHLALSGNGGKVAACWLFEGPELLRELICLPRASRLRPLKAGHTKIHSAAISSLLKIRTDRNGSAKAL